MLLRPITEDEKARYNQVVHHPLQSWEWGEFRKKTGVEVERIGFFQGGQLQKAIEITFHPIPFLGKTAGYLPKGDMPDQEQLAAIKQIGKQHNALFIKIEPNVAAKVSATTSAHTKVGEFLMEQGAVPGKPLFTKYTFQLDLTQPEEKLYANLKQKTRYNINVAYKKGVTIVEDSSEQGIETYLEILAETTKRQGFYAHGPEYFREMWKTIGQSGMIRIFQAVYEETVISSWIMFVFDDVLYYPYGASRDLHRNVMANNLMMWEMIRFGKSIGCHMLDMWGALGPDADPKSSWYGFHHFKEGYSGDLIEFLGTFDIVLDPQLYKVFRFADDWRWKLLRFKTKFGL